MWTDGVPVDASALEQLREVSRLPFIHHHVAAMPDVHWGIGATVGSVIPMKGAIVPAAVGVDIGCGMVAQRLGIGSERLPDNLAGVRSAIEARVPVGFNSHDAPQPQAARALGGVGHDVIERAGLWRARTDPLDQVGTLGGGNHFIEICLDEADQVWIMLHSGSRGVGNRVGRHFISLAKRECEKSKIRLPSRDLAYLPEQSELFDDYIAAVSWCQDYARLNRDTMLRLVLEALHAELGAFPAQEVAINCHHNYVEREQHFGSQVWVTRKGAVSARLGELGIIPGSMGARSFIVKGKGSAESFHSCSHGAGRAMSRRQAKRVFSVEDHIAATRGVECRKDAGVLDETPGAYKDIDAVMAAQTDLVEVVHTLHQVVCVKG
jgi:tRNA-splicing ligase RtcB